MSKKTEFCILSDGNGRRQLLCNFDLGHLGAGYEAEPDEKEFEVVFKGEASDENEMRQIVFTEYYEPWVMPMPIRLHGKKIQTMADMLDAMIPYYRMDIEERKLDVEFYEWAHEEGTLAKIIPVMLFDEERMRRGKGGKMPKLLLNAAERDMLAKDLINGSNECSEELWDKINKAV